MGKLKTTQSGYYMKAYDIKVGDVVVNNLFPDEHIVVKELQFDQAEQTYYINGWSLNHFTKVEMTNPEVEKLKGKLAVLQIYTNGIKDLARQYNSHIRNLLSVIFCHNLVGQKDYDKAISDLDKELTYSDLKEKV